ncbi:MAG: hypothetical protein U9R79_18570 [Armatimonadota bacterium]|nr:hypothetical protein [Armatimonadota bacterium]
MWDIGELWDAEDVRQTPITGWFGTSGLVVVPTAEVLEYQDMQVHFTAVDDEDLDWQYVWGANTCILPGLEAGVTMLDDAYTPAEVDSELVFQAKYQLDLQEFLELSEDFPTVAIGGRDLADDVNRAVYVTFTKDLTATREPESAVRLTVGLGETEIGDAPLDGLFAGVDMTPFDFARLQLEHDGENFNAALRYWWSEWAITGIGVVDGQPGVTVVVSSQF